MSGAIDGMARAICASAGADYDGMHPDSISAGLARHVAHAAWAYALAALGDPSQAMIDAAFDGGAMISEISDALIAWERMHEAFAAEHGIDPQEPASPEPQG